jgi:hypothetical protein
MDAEVFWPVNRKSRIMMHVDFDCQPPEHLSEAEKRQARLRYLARAIPAMERELRALREEFGKLKQAQQEVLAYK